MRLHRTSIFISLVKVRKSKSQITLFSFLPKKTERKYLPNSALEGKYYRVVFLNKWEQNNLLLRFSDLLVDGVLHVLWSNKITKLVLIYRGKVLSIKPKKVDILFVCLNADVLYTNSSQIHVEQNRFDLLEDIFSKSKQSRKRQEKSKFINDILKGTIDVQFT